MNVMVMGAGGQGAPCASILARDEDVERIRLCDINETLLARVKERIHSPKLEVKRVDAARMDEIVTAAEGMDVIIDLVTPALFYHVYRAALAAGVHYVNTAWEEFLYEGFGDDNDSGVLNLGAKLKHSDAFREKGLTALLGCGMTSGYTTNVLIRHYADKLDTLESIKIRLAKKDLSVEPDLEILRPWNPGWNPRQALLDFVVPTYKFEDGRFVRMTELFAEPELWDFPAPVGRTLVAHHAHEEPFSLPQSFAEKGLMYCDFKYYVNKQLAPIVALGLGEEKKVEIKGAWVSPLEVVLHYVPQPGDAFLNEDPSQFEYLDRTKQTSIMFEMIGTRGGKKHTYLIHVANPEAQRRQMYELYGTSLINVALPAVIGAKMAVLGTEKGTVSPQALDSGKFLELMKKSGYPCRWQEIERKGEGGAHS